MYLEMEKKRGKFIISGFLIGHRENPDIINHQSILREYGTLGRMPREQPPPYQDFLTAGGDPQMFVR